MNPFVNCLLLLLLIVGMIYAIPFLIRRNKLLEQELYDMMIVRPVKVKKNWRLNVSHGNLHFLLMALLISISTN